MSLWVFSQSDAHRGPITTESRSAACCVLPALFRRRRGNWPATSAPAATATGLWARATSPRAQVREPGSSTSARIRASEQLLAHRPVPHGVLLRRRVQAVPAVSSGRLPTGSGEDAVLPLWGRAEHQAGRSQLLP